jgi:hypothetical protein
MFGRRMGLTLGGFGELRSRAQVLVEHNTALAELKKELNKIPCLHAPNLMPRKRPIHPVPLPVEKCSSISIKQLEVPLQSDCTHCTHRGKVLKGKLITEAIKMQSVQSVLEDAAGDVVTVCTAAAACALSTPSWHACHMASLKSLYHKPFSRPAKCPVLLL